MQIISSKTRTSYYYLQEIITPKKLTVSMFNFRKKKKADLEKSINSQVSRAAVLMDNQGNLLNTFFYNNVDEISSNASVATIIAKQSSIINEGDLIAKEKKDGYDDVSDNKGVNEFINFLRRPNSEPSPRTLSEINNYIIRRNYQEGIGALIFCFDNTPVLSFSRKRNIKLAQNINYLRNDFNNRSYYSVSYDSTGSKEFYYDKDYLNYVYKTQDEVQILFVFGNYDLKYQQWRSVFNDKIDHILLQNLIIKYTNSFHKNACFPSQLIKISYKGADAQTGMSNQDMAKFQAAVDDFKVQLRNHKGPDTAGFPVIPNHPLLDIDIIPLSIPTNAEDNLIYHNLSSDEIYPQVDGGSSNSYKGKSEYSSESEKKLIEMYDGAIRSYRMWVLDRLNVFMENLLLVMKTPARNAYLDVNTAKIKIYQKQMIAQATMITQNNGITLNEFRRIVKLCATEYSFLTDNKDGDVFNGAIVKNETKANPTVEPKK